MNMMGTSRSGRSNKKRAASPMNSEISLEIHLTSQTLKGQVRGSVVKTMVYDKKLLGGKLEIPPSECPDGDGVRVGVVKRLLAEKAMLEKDYLDEYGDTVIDGCSQFFVSTNKGQRFVEKIGSSTKSMWECIKRLKKKNCKR